eukprot:gb/GECG01010276.1/.p1 GENE.gb/GECG01010276.1/~~gb/GECG01010276.1/.p1  ORF type:complete len:265 (+),score=61.72 gb/GECG01010276.1/:1-795(+)
MLKRQSFDEESRKQMRKKKEFATEKKRTGIQEFFLRILIVQESMFRGLYTFVAQVFRMSQTQPKESLTSVEKGEIETVATASLDQPATKDASIPTQSDIAECKGAASNANDTETQQSTETIPKEESPQKESEEEEATEGIDNGNAATAEPTEDANKAQDETTEEEPSKSNSDGDATCTKETNENVAPEGESTTPLGTEPTTSDETTKVDNTEEDVSVCVKDGTIENSSDQPNQVQAATPNCKRDPDTSIASTPLEESTKRRKVA